MKGQLWQECFCGGEPVCSACEKCQRHYKCGKTQKPEPSQPVFELYRKGIGQGFGSTEDGQE